MWTLPTGLCNNFIIILKATIWWQENGSGDSDWSVPCHTPPSPLSCCPSLLTFTECLPASETPSHTQWHLGKEKKKGGGKNIISVAEGTGEMKSFTLWPHPPSSSGGSRCSRRPKGKDVRRSTAALNGRTKCERWTASLLQGVLIRSHSRAKSAQCKECTEYFLL